MSARGSLACAALALTTALLGCGGDEIVRPAAATATDAGVDATDAAPPSATVRTMVQRGLFGAAKPTNLLLDPTFEQGSPGIGRWFFNGGGTAPAVLQQAILSDSPTGVGLVAGVAEDGPGPGTSGNAISFVTQVPGGAGPFRVGVWLSVDPRENQPSPPSLVRISFAQSWAEKGSPSTLDVGLVADATRVIGARTWYRFEAEAPGPNPFGSLLTIRLRTSSYRWYLLAPEVTPIALDGAPSGDAGPTTRARAVARLREADDEELALFRAYRRQLFPGVPASELPRRSRATP